MFWSTTLTLNKKDGRHVNSPRVTPKHLVCPLVADWPNEVSFSVHMDVPYADDSGQRTEDPAVEGQSFYNRGLQVINRWFSLCLLSAVDWSTMKIDLKLTVKFTLMRGDTDLTGCYGAADTLLHSAFHSIVSGRFLDQVCPVVSLCL